MKINIRTTITDTFFLLLKSVVKPESDSKILKGEGSKKKTNMKVYVIKTLPI
jgi:hypothetical protein